MLVVLSSVGLLSGALLMSVNLLTREKIADNKQKEIEAAVTIVIPGTETSQKIYEEKDFTVYEGIDAQGQVVGFAIQTAVAGFQDKILFLFGTNAPLTKINSLYILDQKETPGLGAKITDHEAFLQFWEEKVFTRPLTLHKPPAKKENLSSSEVNTITGATISSEAVLSGVNKSLEKIKQLKEEGRLFTEGAHAK